jgi:predicted dehydrogenase
VLDRSDVDAVVLATPNHWHALQTIWACQAGKDVYVESPATHFLSEGAPMVAAAARHARMVQCGLQWRASTAIAAALAWLRAGDLGTPELVHAMCFEPRASLGKTRGNQRVADTVDYDRWCGPSPLLPLRRARLHHDWRWVHATGDGELGAVGAHVLDLARWAAGAEDLPRTVRSVGMRAVHDDDGETPNAQVVFYGTDPVPILLELRGLPRDAAARAAANSSAVMDTELSVRTGVVVRCTGGTLAIPDPAHAIARDPSGAENRRFEGAGDPFASWLEAVMLSPGVCSPSPVASAYATFVTRGTRQSTTSSVLIERGRTRSSRARVREGFSALCARILRMGRNSRPSPRASPTG